MVRGHLCTKLLFGDPANRETTAEMKAELNKYQLSLTIPRGPSAIAELLVIFIRATLC